MTKYELNKKVLRVIDSCYTDDQLIGAKNFAYNVANQFSYDFFDAYEKKHYYLALINLKRKQIQERLMNGE